MAKITPELLQKLSQPLIDIYNQINTELLEAIAKLLGQDKDLLEDDIFSWQIKKLQQIPALLRSTIKIITANAVKAIKEMIKIITKVAFKGIRENEQILNDAMQQGANLIPPPPLEEDLQVTDILADYEQRVADILNRTNTTMLQQVERVYRDIINRTVSDVLSGIKTPQEALRDTIRGWADHGIPALVDRRGRQWTPEAYVQMVIRTTSNQVTNDLQDERFNSWGVDLVEISSHIGARPLCAPFQGKIFSRSGQHDRFPPLSSTSIGLPAGLFGINCGHNQYPYIEGVSRKTYKPYPSRENDEVYKQSQIQRKLERNIRAAKRELAAMEALGDEEGTKRAKVRIRERQKRMREFISDSGRTRRYNREQVVN